MPLRAGSTALEHRDYRAASAGLEACDFAGSAEVGIGREAAIIARVEAARWLWRVSEPKKVAAWTNPRRSGHRSREPLSPSASVGSRAEHPFMRQSGSPRRRHRRVRSSAARRHLGEYVLRDVGAGPGIMSLNAASWNAFGHCCA